MTGRRSHGSMLCVCLSAALLAGLLLAVPSMADVEPFEVNAYQQTLDVSHGVAEDDLEVQAKGAQVDIAGDLEDKMHGSFAGIWFDPMSGEYVVPMAAASADAAIGKEMGAARLGGDYRTRVVENSWEELEAAQKQIDAQLRELFAVGLVYTAIDPRTNAVVVHVAATANEKDRAALRQIAKSAGGLVELRVSNVEQFQGTRDACSDVVPNCGSPLRGGVEIGPWKSANGGICTAAFRAIGKTNGKKYLLSAGHCAAEKNPSNPLMNWQARDEQKLPVYGQAKYLGEVEQLAFPTHDWMKINVTGSEWDIPLQQWPALVAYWGKGSGVAGQPPIDPEYAINGEAASVVGQSVCHSGIASGGSCGQVVETNVSYNFGEAGNVTYDLVKVKGACSEGGDSGGPWFASNIAYGIHIGKEAALEPCGSATFYEEITDATAALGVSIVPPSSSPPSYQPYFEDDDNSPGPHAIAQSNGTVDVFYRTPSGELGHWWYSPGNGWANETRPDSIAPGAVPHFVAQTNGTIDVFYRTANGGLGHDWTGTSGGWSSGTLPGSVGSDPHATVQSNGTIDVFYRTPSGELGHDWYVQGGSWASGNLPGSVASDPHAVAQTNGTIDVFYRTPAGGMGHDWYDTGGSGWHSGNLAGAVAGDPHAVLQTNGTIDLFYRTPAGELGHDWFAPCCGGWFSANLPGSVASDPRPVVRANGTVDVFYRTPSGELGHDWYDTGGAGWLSGNLPGPLSGDPHPLMQGNGTVDVFFRTPSGELGHDWYDTGGAGWLSGNLPGTLASEPHAAMQPNGTVDVFFRTPSGELGHDWYDTGGAGWLSGNLPGPIAARPPQATSGAATSVGLNEATLNATINPEASPTTYYFEYGKTTSYGSKAPASPKEVGGGTTGVAVSESVSGLESGTTYHYRVVATNLEGTSYGVDNTFVTTVNWTAQSTTGLTPKTELKLEATSCPTATLCMAVGKDNYATKGFAEVWNGSSWNTTNRLDGAINSVSCVSATWCMSVGNDPSGQPRSFRFALAGGIWNYETKTPPTPTGGSELELNDVSCTSESACTVVGTYNNGSREVTYAARYNGSAWTTQTTTNPASGDTELYGVSCSTATSCVAVGRNGTGTTAQTWNGTTWSASTTLNPAGATESRLTEIACNSASACTAVGWSKEGGWKKALAERFNGSTWTIQTTPAPADASGNVALQDVSCATTTACEAVGTYGTEKGTTAGEDLKTKTLAETWNGTAWSVQSSPNSAEQKFNGLNGIACTSISACMAVGSAGPASSWADGTVTSGARYG
jgi:hypothetical protein